MLCDDYLPSGEMYRCTGQTKDHMCSVLLCHRLSFVMNSFAVLPIFYREDLGLPSDFSLCHDEESSPGIVTYWPCGATQSRRGKPIQRTAMRSCPLRRRDRLLMDCFLPPMSCESSHFCGWMVELSSMGHSGFAVATSISDPFRHGAAHSCCQLACGLRHGPLGC